MSVTLFQILIGKVRGIEQEHRVTVKLNYSIRNLLVYNIATSHHNSRYRFESPEDF